MGHIKILAINIFIPARIKYFQNKKYELKVRKFWVHIDLKFSTSVTTKTVFIWLVFCICMNVCVGTHMPQGTCGG